MKKLNLTREEALRLHRQMWTDMQKKLGDNASPEDREKFKSRWCKKHFPDYAIKNDCFLCDYANHNSCETKYCLERCPIDWQSLKKYGWETNDCCAIYEGHDGADDDIYNEIYFAAPISEILALPEKRD